MPFTTGSALLQLQTDPHDRWKMECAFMLFTIHLPRSGGATSPGQMQRIVTRSFGLLVWPEVSSPDIADSASPPRFHPRYCLARKPRKSPSTLSAFAMFDQESSGGAPATNRHNPYSINPGLLDPRRRGLNGCCMSGEFLLLVVNPAPQPLPKTPVSNQNFKLRTRGAAVEPPDI